jgi:hypothetical protein
VRAEKRPMAASTCCSSCSAAISCNLRS